MKNGNGGLYIRLSARHRLYLELSIEIISGILQIVYKIPFENNQAGEITGLSPDELIDRVIIGPTQFPAAMFGAILEALQGARCDQSCRTHILFANSCSHLIGANMTGSLSLRDHPGDLVRLLCAKCGRAGKYPKENLIARYGGNIPLPDLREEIAQCVRARKMHDMCGVHYTGLAMTAASSSPG